MGPASNKARTSHTANPETDRWVVFGKVTDAFASVTAVGGIRTVIATMGNTVEPRSAIAGSARSDALTGTTEDA